MPEKLDPPNLRAPQRQSHDLYKRRRLVNTNHISRPLSRDTSLSPVRRSGSPVRRQHISEIEERARTALVSSEPDGADRASPKKVKFVDNVQDDIDERFSRLQARLEKRLDKFMESVNERLIALESQFDAQQEG
ncbi:hypothetical protein CLIB1423_08S02146 [[Candida] railenensis]|uniref:Uncharacterized protein n=1 Tax=[Candida] railenensis TaxID=45579 RepID=A0A9P0QQG1_9ASCO|nr:hypothetical protein CLIB1423_08S02146 [[Candida] railenensis]